MATDLDRKLDNLERKIDALATVTGETPDLLKDSFPEQRSYVLDPASLKVLFCTRRAAKTFSFGLECVWDGLQNAGANYLFLATNRLVAKRIFWKDVLKVIDDKYRVGMRFNETELTATLPNGSVIYIAGADQNKEELDKLLGGKYKKIGVDEAQSWRHVDLSDLVFRVLKPAVIDWRGSISLMGTPGNHINGYFHRVTKGCRAGKPGNPNDREAGWSLHTWTTYENTSVVDGVRVCDSFKQEIAGLILANARVVETPWFRQMYKGEWVVDVSARCYHGFDRERNAFDALPTYAGGRWHFVLGIDLGYNPDPSAFVLGAYHDWDPNLYLVESWKEWKMDITAVAGRIQYYETKVLANFKEPIDFLVIDGANKQAVEEMRRRHNLDLNPADKRGKDDFIELMNSEFILRKILVNLEKCNQGIQNGEDANKKIIQESLALADEYEGLIWDPKTLPGHPQWKAGTQRKELSSSPNHLCDGALYLWRWAYTYLFSKPKPPPVEGTPEWVQQQVDQMYEADAQEVEARKQPPVGLEDMSDWDPNLS